MEKLRKMSRNEIIDAIVFIAIGIILFVWPGMTIQVFCRAFGAFLAVVGIVKIALNFNRRDVDNESAVDLAVSMSLAVCGVLILVWPEPFLNFIPVMIAAVILFMGLYHISQGVICRRCGFFHWWLALVFAIADLVVGLVVVLRPDFAATTMIRLIAIVLVYNGITLLVLYFLMKRAGKAVEKERKAYAKAAAPQSPRKGGLSAAESGEEEQYAPAPDRAPVSPVEEAAGEKPPVPPASE